MDPIENLRKIARTEFDPTVLAIDRLFEARQRADFCAHRALMGRSVNFRMVGDARLSSAIGEVEGVDSVMNLIWRLCSEYQWVERTVEEITKVDQVFVVRRSSLCRHVRTGHLEKMPACTLLKFKGGLVSEVIDYTDTSLLAKLMSGRNVWVGAPN